MVSLENAPWHIIMGFMELLGLRMPPIVVIIGCGYHTPLGIWKIN
jgi:hypothetical protein